MPVDLPLGQPTPYPTAYTPSLLVPIERRAGRRALGLTSLPFTGVDVWTAYELSWLDGAGKPVVATGELWVPAESPCLVESKSLKLYLNSLSGTRHATPGDVSALLRDDLRGVLGADLEVRLTLLADVGPTTLEPPPGERLDDQVLAFDDALLTGGVDPALLAGSAADGHPVDETLVSHLLKSNCPVTGQPDWATLSIHYRGGRIDREALLRYVVSYRSHDEFHEGCVERIFTDVLRHCRPTALSVLARYTRRGGIDINPFRSNFEPLTSSARLWRQ